MAKYGTSMILAVASLALAGCGVSPGCRAVSTGVLGAGTGAAIAAIAGGPIGLAAAIGGEREPLSVRQRHRGRPISARRRFATKLAVFQPSAPQPLH
jgi:hypothetical protein